MAIKLRNSSRKENPILDRDSRSECAADSIDCSRRDGVLSLAFL